jgi:hypothetical protein
MTEFQIVISKDIFRERFSFLQYHISVGIEAIRIVYHNRQVEK